jgi:hypothetical protein
VPQIAINTRLIDLMGKGGNESYVGKQFDAPITAPVSTIPPLNTPGRRSMKRFHRALSGQFTRSTRAA